jgi:molecular chaperone DnaK (HSP70)
MVEESFQYAEADVEARMLIEVRNEAETVLTHVRRALRQAGHLMTPPEATEISAALAALEQAAQGTDRDLIRERTTALNRATERLAELMMDAALKGALGSRRAAEIMAGEGPAAPPKEL